MKKANLRKIEQWRNLIEDARERHPVSFSKMELYSLLVDMKEFLRIAALERLDKGARSEKG